MSRSRLADAGTRVYVSTYGRETTVTPAEAGSTVDPKTNKTILPPGCAAAYRKYLELDPNGQFAADVTGTLQRAGESIKPSGADPKN